MQDDAALQNSTANTLNRSTGLHLFKVWHARLLEIRKLQLSQKPGSNVLIFMFKML